MGEMEKVHVYLDDWRPCPEGFVLAKNAEECLLLLRECRVGILSLDHDLGAGELTGTDLVIQMIQERLFADVIYLHTSSLEGKRRMHDMLQASKPEHVVVFPYPIPNEVLNEFRPQ
ncbi:cyclic-phosphate processing receiver domain-containing protein [Marinicrinis sediminis]|uniref:Cyclic-phosphate processing receiver domain-containing protein n=1 Tax=Marinicrinis sediminis TaxID=1652465 RepID=A0ABW5RDK3_9BACL